MYTLQWLLIVLSNINSSSKNRARKLFSRTHTHTHMSEWKLKILHFDVYCITVATALMNRSHKVSNFIHKEAICDTHVCKLRSSHWNWFENQTKSKRKFYGGDTFSIIYGQCSIKGYFETLWIIFLLVRGKKLLQMGGDYIWTDSFYIYLDLVDSYVILNCNSLKCHFLMMIHDLIGSNCQNIMFQFRIIDSHFCCAHFIVLKWTNFLSIE